MVDRKLKSVKGRKPKAYSQSDRLARMMRTLASRAATINELSEQFGITRRQIYRDLAEIENEGHPLERSGGSGEQMWQLPLGYKGLPQIAITPYELLSLHLAKNHLAYLKETPFVDDLDEVIAKVEAGLPVKTANHLERISRVFAPVQGPKRAYANRKKMLSDLRRALLLQRTVILHHQTPEYGEPTLHPVDPFALVLYQYGLYIAGYSHRSKAQRLFAVERIHRVRLTEDSFDMPSDSSWEALSPNAFGLIDEPPMTVRIRFSANVAYLLKERQWHPTQSLKQQKDKSVVITFQAGGLDEITSWVLSWGADAKVLSPPELIQSVRAHLIAARKQYTSTKSNV